MISKFLNLKGEIVSANAISRGVAMLLISVCLAACSDHEKEIPVHGQVGVAIEASAIPNNTVDQAGPSVDITGGSNQKGVLIATGLGLVTRIENGLEKNALATRGNFKKTLAQVKTNLPSKTNVTEAAGFDQVQLLTYAACSDLTTGNTPLMTSVYGVSASANIATNQAALVAAGMRMLDQHTAGLASQGPDAAAVTTVLTNLVQAQASVATNTSTMAFITVCIAANTAGTTMLGL